MVKKIRLTVLSISVLFLMVSCEQPKPEDLSKHSSVVSASTSSSSSNESKVEFANMPEEPYTFSGETYISSGDCSLKLEDVSETLAEETVIKNFICIITGDFNEMEKILADTEHHQISIKWERLSKEEGAYIRSYVVHNITTLDKEQYTSNKTSSGEYNSLFFPRWDEMVAEYNLVSFRIINADFTQTCSEKMVEMDPQWGEGTYNRSFLVGKSQHDENYKIYCFGMMM